MRNRTNAYQNARKPLAASGVMPIGLLIAAAGWLSTDAANASDIQAATDRAAVKAKAELCIALNRGRDITQLKEKFFEFYEGERVAAETLDPKTFKKGQIGPLPAIKVVQVLGPNEMLASTGSGMLKLKDVSTADVADDQLLRLPEFFLVRETETYNTVAGSTNTVYVLVPAGDRIGRVNATRVYPWYNRKDEVVITGEFKRIDGTYAIFSVNGGDSRVPLTKFTRGDRELMRMLLDRYPQALPKKEPEAEPREQIEENLPGPPQPAGID